MKERLVQILENMKKYNSGYMSREIFGFEPETEYDALVVAPGWKPDKIIKDEGYTVTPLAQHSYFSGFLAERDGVRVAWAQTASGACNLIDHLIVCAELRFRRLIFVGAVGSLVPGFDVGDFCTPEVCISGVYADKYLRDRLPERVMPFELVHPNTGHIREVSELAAQSGYNLRLGKVFCTDSIALEYSHLDEIRATGAELIEMETSAFYTLAELFETPSAALLVVSDNSATGAPLLGRGEEADKKYKRVRSTVIPDMIFRIAALK